MERDFYEKSLNVSGAAAAVVTVTLMLPLKGLSSQVNMSTGKSYTHFNTIEHIPIHTSK